MLLDVQGAVADIEKAFQVKMRVYQHPKENRTFFAPDAEPSVPAGLPVLDISGLNNYAPAASQVRAQADEPGATGRGDAEPWLRSGRHVLWVRFQKRLCSRCDARLAAGRRWPWWSLTAIWPATSRTMSPGRTAQMSRCKMCCWTDSMDYPPGLAGRWKCRWTSKWPTPWPRDCLASSVYEGSPINFFPNDVLNTIATDNVGQANQLFLGMDGRPNDHDGSISSKKWMPRARRFSHASGDSDSLATGEVDDPTLTWVPSDNPYITSVGATTLSTTGPLGSFVSETVWQAGSGVGSTGGVSAAYYAIPAWQQPVSMATNGGSTNFRNFPDVAMVGTISMWSRTAALP